MGTARPPTVALKIFVGRSSGQRIGSQHAYSADLRRLLRLGYDRNSNQYHYNEDDGATALFIAHLVSSVMYHVDKAKEKRDLRWKAIGVRQMRSPEPA
jgi:hypothetical protein